MSARVSFVLFWTAASATLAAICAVVVRIARTPGAPYPVTSAVLAAVLLLGLLYLALREFFGDADARFERRLHRDIARNFDPEDR